MYRTRVPLKDRFMASFRKEPSGCWIWEKERSQKQYGMIRCGPPGGPPMRIGAHRAAWILWYGPVPEGMLVLHRCDTPPCVNPRHLFIGSEADNTADMLLKHRGAGLPRRLTDEQAADILTEYASGRSTKASLARKYGVERGTIRALVLRRTYKNVKPRAEAERIGHGKCAGE